MAEKPILFNGEMVRALLDGRKTQTRRPVKLGDLVEVFGDDLCCYGRSERGWHFGSAEYPDEGTVSVRPPYATGDLLYVRERFALSIFDPEELEPDPKNPEHWDLPVYHATYEPGGGWTDADGRPIAPPWRPSIHMPKWAARIWLRVTGVRVERVQDITEADAEAEGCALIPDSDPQPGSWPCPMCAGALLHGALGANYGYVEVDCRTCDTAGKRFALLWNAAYPGSWDRNDWVWVYEFERAEAPR